MTDSLGQSQVIPYLQGLSKEGYQFTLLSCEKTKRFESNKSIIETILQKSNIKWAPIFYHKNPPVISSIYDTFNLLKTAKKLHQENKFNLVHCRSYISSIIGLWLYKKYSVPFIFDMRGFYADERVDGKLWNLQNPIYNSIYRFFKNKEKQFLMHSAATISLTEAGKAIMEEWETVKENNTKITVIPCSADFDLFKISSVAEKKQNRKNLNISTDTFVLSYLGSIGTWYMLDEMLDFFVHLEKKYNKVLFLFLTPEDPQVIRNVAKSKNIRQENILIDFAQRADLAKKISISDASIFFIRPCFSKISSSPTKLGELLAMGIPVICNDGVGDVKEIVDITKGGACISSFTGESYKNAIDQLDYLITIDPQEIRMNAQSYYDLGIAIKKYSTIYSDILY